jgi:AcrR family transcriptional regulator
MPSSSPVEYPRRSKHSHRAVLKAAGELLAERGYAKITIEAIAARVGVGKTTIYRWWPAKASIYMELYTELAAETLPPLSLSAGDSFPTSNLGQN